MARKEIKSVGIDIGTTTTQLICSQLTLINRSPASQVPTYEFIDRKILYKSPVSFTPIDHYGVIDTKLLSQFINNQLELANISKDEIETGAIIITGETAKASNAKDSVMNLSSELGDFVVATAGPHLESIISGKGSGAFNYAKSNHAKVINIDIGGGTSNYVIFDSNKVISSACLNVGGRLIEFNNHGEITYIHKAGSMIIQALFGENISPKQLTNQHLKKIAQKMSELIIEVITGNLSSLCSELLMTSELKSLKEIDAIFLSGGVGSCFYQQQQEKVAENQYNDIGPMLAIELLQNKQLHEFNIKKPDQTIRATVIGAGAHTLSLSGSTIWVNNISLPIKNIPTVHPQLDWINQDSKSICESIVQACIIMDLSIRNDLYAISLDQTMPIDYKSVKKIGQALCQFFKEHQNKNNNIIVISYHDIGKILGMTIQSLIGNESLMVIDEIYTQAGDYIDIGSSYFNGNIVPLTIKSLAFPNN